MSIFNLYKKVMVTMVVLMTSVYFTSCKDEDDDKVEQEDPSYIVVLDDVITNLSDTYGTNLREEIMYQYSEISGRSVFLGQYSNEEKAISEFETEMASIEETVQSSLLLEESAYITYVFSLRNVGSRIRALSICAGSYMLASSPLPSDFEEKYPPIAVRNITIKSQK